VRGFALLALDCELRPQPLKRRLKHCLSQNLLTFRTWVQRFVVGHFGEDAANLGEQKLVVRGVSVFD
jgi:hypothetical protein